MSSLPAPTLPTEEVAWNGQTVRIRSLTRAEAYALNALGDTDPDHNENYILACGTDSTVEEAAAFRAATGFAETTPLVDAILKRSGLRSTNVEDPDETAPKGSTKRGAPVS